MDLRNRRPSAEALLATFGMRVPPFDVHGLAIAMGIDVKFKPDLPYSGEVRTSAAPPFARMTINSSDTPTRQRFTIAHEIGHVMLHPLGRRFRDTNYQGVDPETRRCEAQANGYAAKLLMPDWVIPVALRRVRAVEDLAKAFQVSSEAMRVRLEHMGYPIVRG